MLPDSSLLAHYVVRRLDRLLRGLHVDAERMRENLWSSHGLVFSQPVLLALVAAGATRDDAYRIVQRNAMQAWEERTDFRTLLEDDPEVTLAEGRTGRGVRPRTIAAPPRSGRRRARSLESPPRRG